MDELIAHASEAQLRRLCVWLWGYFTDRLGQYVNEKDWLDLAKKAMGALALAVILSAQVVTAAPPADTTVVRYIVSVTRRWNGGDKVCWSARPRQLPPSGCANVVSPFWTVGDRVNVTTNDAGKVIAIRRAR